MNNHRSLARAIGSALVRASRVTGAARTRAALNPSALVNLKGVPPLKPYPGRKNSLMLSSEDEVAQLFKVACPAFGLPEPEIEKKKGTVQEFYSENNDANLLATLMKPGVWIVEYEARTDFEAAELERGRIATARTALLTKSVQQILKKAFPKVKKDFFANWPYLIALDLLSNKPGYDWRMMTDLFYDLEVALHGDRTSAREKTLDKKFKTGPNLVGYTDVLGKDVTDQLRTAAKSAENAKV